jgi:hypothetical protein
VERIRIAAAAFALLLLLQIIRSVRREHIRVEYSMTWFAAALGLLALSVSDTALEWLSSLLGVEDLSFTLLLLAGVLFLFTFFRFSVEVSTLKDHNILVSQKVGLLEWQLRKQQQQIDELHDAPSDDDRSEP